MLAFMTSTAKWWPFGWESGYASQSVLCQHRGAPTMAVFLRVCYLKRAPSKQHTQKVAFPLTPPEKSQPLVPPSNGFKTNPFELRGAEIAYFRVGHRAHSFSGNWPNRSKECEGRLILRRRWWQGFAMPAMELWLTLLILCKNFCFWLHPSSNQILYDKRGGLIRSCMLAAS